MSAPETPNSMQAITLSGLSASPLSSAIVAGETIYTSGQVGRDPRSGRVAPDLAGQIEQAMLNLQDVLRAAGGSLATVVKTTVFLTSRQDVAAMNQLYAPYFPATKPARSTLIVGLAQPELLFEIEAIALRTEERP